MIPVVPKISPTAVANPPGYRVGKRYFPAASQLTPGQIYSSGTLRHQRTDGMVARADYSAALMPAYGMQVRTPSGSVTQPINHFQYHFWDNLKWYWRNMRWSLPEQDYAQVFNQMGNQLPGQPMMMMAQPRYTRVLNAPRYNTIPSGVTPTSSQPGTAVPAVSTSIVGMGAMARRKFYNAAPWKAKGPEFHG